MIGAIVHQLTKNLTEEEIMKGGFADYFVDHTLGVYPIAASGVPFTAAYIAVKGDTIADLTEDLAADGATSQKQSNEKSEFLDSQGQVVFQQDVATILRQNEGKTDTSELEVSVFAYWFEFQLFIFVFPLPE
jgi:hypothetical protein